MTVLVTRPEPDATRTAATFEAAGLRAVAAPILTIVPEGTVPRPAESAVLAFTSANGVRAYAQRGGPRRAAYCVGPMTADAARAAGLEVAGVAAGDVASLAALLLRARPAHVLHVRGRHATGDLTGRLSAAGLNADAASLYEAVPVSALPPAAAAALRAGADAALFSPRSARLLAHLMRSEGLGNALESRTLLALSAAVADAFGLPVGQVFVPKHPSSSAFVDFLSGRRT